MIKNLKKKKKAFTLVEVIIVLAIIAIIAAIAIPNLTKVREDSKIKADNQSMETMARTLDMLYTDGTLKGAGKISVTFNDNSVQVNLEDTISGSNSEELESYFAKVKAPQEKGKTAYNFTIGEDENIEYGTTDEPMVTGSAG